MSVSSLPPLVTVFGGSGFVGRHVVSKLARRGYRIRVAVRRPDLAFFLQPLGNVGQISLTQANLRCRDSVHAAVKGANLVINCVGILFESGRNSFDAVQDSGARIVAQAANAQGARLVHVSAIGADPKSHSAYAASKGRAEKAILKIASDAVILRPSIIFGPEDRFFNKFAAMAQTAPVLPLIGGGKTRLQPVYVEDVAEVAARAADGDLEAGKTYELGGSEILTFRQCLEKMLDIIDRKKPLINLPFGLASMIGGLMSMIPFIEPMLTADQVELLKHDNIVSDTAREQGRTLEGLGIHARTVLSVLPDYLVRYRPHGQYNRFGKAA